jgi:hypothetical protein
MNPYAELIPLEHAKEWQKLNDIVHSDEFHDKCKWDFHTPTVADMVLYHTITPEQYEEFQYYWILDALKGWRYGQAFCERFGITNASPLYHFKTQETAERWIRDNYLVKK